MKLTTLMFHRFGESRFKGDIYSNPPTILERIIDYCEKNHHPVISLDKIDQSETNGKKTSILFTFDDGYASDYEVAFQILLKNNLAGVFFVVPFWIGTKDYLTWEQLIRMKDAGMTIGSHSLTHHWLPELSDERLREELVSSQEILEDKLAVPITAFSLPGGYYSPRVIRAVYQAGYQKVFSSDIGVDSIAESKRLYSRISIDQRTSWEAVEKYIRGQIAFSTLLKGRIKRFVATAIGPTNYKRLSDRYRRSA